MVSYGYHGNHVDSTGTVKLINPPPKLDKIHLALSRPKFIVTGTKDSIFDWMENYGKLACIFGQETHSHLMSCPKPPKRHDHSKFNDFKLSLMKEDPNVIIVFELHVDEERHQNHHKLLKIFQSSGTKKYHGSTRMRLEIKACGPSALECEDQGSVMKAQGPSGVRLQQVLRAWIEHEKTYILNIQQRIKDFE